MQNVEGFHWRDSPNPIARDAIPIPRVRIQDLSVRQFHEQYRKPGRPVVILGLVNEPDWNLEFLCDQLGDRELLCRYYAQENRPEDKRTWTTIGSGTKTRSLRFSEYADLVRSGEAKREDIYIAKFPIGKTPLNDSPSLHQWGEKLGFEKAVSGLNLWLGHGGHLGSLHYDTLDGTIAQLHGRKRLILFPPSQLYNLYPIPLVKHLTGGLKLRSWFAQVYADKPEFDKFPKLELAFQHRYDVVLEPGELLYIPAGWWHEISTLGDGLVASVNRFWAVSPLSRTLLSWSAWRTYLGLALAMPSMLVRLMWANVQPNRQQEIEKVLRMF